jgi:hypothetical protein
MNWTREKRGKSRARLSFLRPKTFKPKRDQHLLLDFFIGFY